MRILSFLTLIASLLLINCEIHAQKRSVLDYYRMLELNDYYKITLKNNKYYTSGVTETPFEIIVDLKNGYIEIEDEGTGGGTITNQIVLFRKSDKSALIAHSHRVFDGVGIESELKFYELKNGKLSEVKNIYHFSKQTFMKEIIKKFPEDLDKTIALELTSLVFDLPQYGLTSEVSFFVRTYVNKEETRKSEVQQKLLKMDLTPIKWKWNKVIDQFEIVKP